MNLSSQTRMRYLNQDAASCLSINYSEKVALREGQLKHRKQRAKKRRERENGYLRDEHSRTGISMWHGAYADRNVT